MSVRVLLFLIFTAVAMERVTASECSYNASEGCQCGSVLHALTSIADSLARISATLENGRDATEKAATEVEKTRDILVDGQGYYLISIDGKFCVFDKQKKLGFAKSTDSDPTTFVAFKKGWNVYALCTVTHCMARCAGCSTDIGDDQSVKFHEMGHDGPSYEFSHWTIENVTNSVDGLYILQSKDWKDGYLTVKATRNMDYQLTLGTGPSSATQFMFVPAL